MMYRATGYTPSQVTSEPVCDAPSPGRAGCDAEALVSKSTGQPVRPLASSLSAEAAGSAVATPDALQSATPDLYTPGYLQEAYDTGWLSASAGTGKTVAIIDAYGDSTAVSDLSTFRSTYGLPVLSTCGPASIATHSSGGPCLTVVSQTGSTTSLPTQSSSWEDEMSLDLDAVSALCPNCNILLIETKSNSYPNLATGDAEALKLGVKLISNSFGGPMSGDSDYFTQMEANTNDEAGAETFASTGDSGAYAADGYTAAGQTNADQAPYPASEPGITAVGGTSLAPSSNARGIAESAWSGAGSACSTFDAQPSWQASVNTGCSGRAVADVSADADPGTGLTTYDSYSGGWVTLGGTSLAAPLTAAYVALTGVNGSSTANADGSLSGEWVYADASELNDITSGNNGTCPASTAYASPQTCTAGVGWDGPTGMGSISGDVVTSSAGPSLTVPPSGGVDNGSNGYSIVQSLAGTSATFDGGVYPNSSTTSVWWEYGTSSLTAGGTNFSSANSTASQTVGLGTAALAATPTSVTHLSSGSVYYAEECASNNGGSDTTCGNVTEFTTGSGPDANGAPTITATSLGYGGDLSLSSSPTWTSGATVTYQWQESSDGSTWSNVSGVTTSPSSYALQSSDSQQYLRLQVNAVNGSGTTVDDSNVLRALPMPPAASTPSLTDISLGYGGQISVAAPSWSPPATSVTYQWQESASGTGAWTSLTNASSTNSPYTIQLSDSQQYIRAEIVGTNSSGSTTLDTSPVQAQNFAPAASGSAAITDSDLGLGGVLSISSAPSWSGASSVADQWQESTDDSNWSNISGANANSYTIALSDSEQYIRLAVIATNAGGSTTLTSNVVQVEDLVPVSSGGGSTANTSAGGGSQGGTVTISDEPHLSGASTVGGTLKVTAGSYENAGAVTVTFERCSRTCTVLQSGSATTYKLRPADAGYYVVTIVKVAGIGGAASADTTAGLIGPVLSPTVGALRITGALGTVKTGTKKDLLQATRRVIKSKSTHKPSTYVLTLTRSARVRGRIQAWVCVLAGSSLVSCSRPVTVAGTPKIRTSVPVGDRLELIAVG
jgi:hypothetical protein